MSLWTALLMGLVQGLTEFLPISSSAHLRILGALLPGAADPGAAFTAIIQIGTELAVLLYFRRDVKRIVLGWWRAVRHRQPNRDGSQGWLIIIGTIPVVVLGVIFSNAIETNLRSLYLTALMLIGFGLLLGLADKLARQRLTMENLGPRDGLLLGFAQALALIPGVSRSGGTITAGLALGYTRPAAARYAFLLAMPAVFGSGLYELARSLGNVTATFPGWGATLLATLVAFLVGYVVVIAFMRLISSVSFKGFAYYRIGLGCVLLLLLLTGLVKAV